MNKSKSKRELSEAKKNAMLADVLEFGLHALTSAAQRSGMDVAPNCCDLHKLAREQFGDVRGVFDPNNMHHPQCWRFRPAVMSAVDEICRSLSSREPERTFTVACCTPEQGAKADAMFEAQMQEMFAKARKDKP